MSNAITDIKNIDDIKYYSPSDSDNEQFPITVKEYKTTYSKINKEIEKYYKDENSESEEEEEELINKSQSLIFSSIRTNNVNQRIINSIKTTQFLIHDYYKVTSSLLINNNQYKNINNYTNNKINPNNFKKEINKNNKINNNNNKNSNNNNNNKNKKKNNKKNFNNNIPELFSKSITFALGKSQYVAISDISGIILFLDLQSKSIEILKGLDDSSGFCTSLAFSYDLTFLYAGYLLGDVKVFDISSLAEIKCLSNVFLNPVNFIIPYSNSDFLICDNVNNVFNFCHSRSFLIYNNFDYKRLGIFGGNNVKNLDFCEVNAEYVYENDSDVIGIACFDNNEIILFQLIPEKKNLEVLYKNDDTKIINGFFNRKKYSFSKRIFFFIFSTADISIYEVVKKSLNSKNFYKTELLKLIPLETQSAFSAQWLNDNTISVFLKDFKIIHIYNFPFISQKDNFSITKSDLIKMNTNLNLKIKEDLKSDLDFIFKEEVLPDNFEFEISEKVLNTQETSFNIILINENPRKIIIMDYRGRLMDVYLGKWREYFNNEFEISSLRVFLEKFWEVYKGKYCFFNDFIFENLRRKKLMGMFLNNKIESLFDSNPISIEKNLSNIMNIYVKMDNYNFIYFNIKEYFDSIEKTYFYLRTLESLVKKNKIKQMPMDLVLQIAKIYIKEGKKKLIRSLILNLNFENEQLDSIIDFCLENKFFIALISLCINEKPPQLGKLINHISEKMENNFVQRRESLGSYLEPFKKTILNNFHDFKIEEVSIWLFNQFLKKNIFDYNLENNYFEMYFETYFVVFFKSNAFEKILKNSYVDFAIICIQFFSIDNYIFLNKRHHFPQVLEINTFINQFSENLKNLEDEKKKFLKLLLQLLFDNVEETYICNIMEIFKELINYLEINEYVFPEFIYLLKISLIEHMDEIESSEHNLIEKIIEIYSNSKFLHLCILELITDYFIAKNDFKSAFEILGLFFKKESKVI